MLYRSGMTTDPLAHLPPIQTARLHLRPLETADSAELRRLTDHPAITRAIHFLPTPFTLSEAERLILGSGRDRFVGAWLEPAGDMVAVIGIHLHGTDEIEIGYWVGADSHGQGLATEAVAAVLGVLQPAFADRQVIAECRTENRASWRVLEKLGFRAIGAAGRRPGRQRLVLASVRRPTTTDEDGI